MGMIDMARPDHEAAASSLQKGIALFERCGEEHMASTLRVMFGTTQLVQGEDEQAEKAFEEALVSARRLKVPSLTYIALYNSAQSALGRGDLEKAARMLEEGIEWSMQTKDRTNLVYFLEALAAVNAFGGGTARAAVLIGAAEALLETGGKRVHRQYVSDPSPRGRAVAEVRSALGEAAFENARTEGRAMTLDQAVGYALQDDKLAPT
jgi:non-specific serine/threonine protein kinase